MLLLGAKGTSINCRSVLLGNVSLSSDLTREHVTRTGVTMQTSAKRAKFSSVYEWLQVGRLERFQVQRGGRSLSRSGSLACLYSQPKKTQLSPQESTIPSNVNQPYDYNSLALITQPRA